jgi:DNA-binding MarR family transcriptional regulator
MGAMSGWQYPDGIGAGQRVSAGRGRAGVTSREAEWLAGHLWALVMTRPAEWAACDMTLSQLMALHFISARSPVSLAGLAEELGTQPPATCAMVDRLSRAGLVSRTKDPKDHRRIHLTVTGKAEPLIGEIDLETARRLQTVLIGMSVTARRCLGEALTETARRLAR